ncbi:hypothetical protein SMACR_08987 [Sordaria macrospora]|uniref:WGS project CABT00000000 data, contig 2.31 n=2 Tax=Sordaria macrospora TaxID=5147 RepID=F7W5S8_SORMK|nr:uncharacterized protein SMAC_08987 [Sordaria macrospora k-hell]KAA8635540.1 hypothetical protein SMACR_08987 [Sordaria macrospora]WPJ66283.1 hypothetical protein SMAC4_08987 [Sordaria macrospora]CCC12866.1 unnamed protein product [Sordaria macrospora k-hell]
MPTSTLTRVAHRARSPPHYYKQQRFATVDTSGRRGSGGGIGKAAETIAADIDSDLDYPTEMDERYSTSSWSEASRSSAASSPRMSSHERAASPSSSGFTSRAEKTTSGIGSEPNRPSYDSNAASDATVRGPAADNTLFYLAMGLIGLSGAYIVLKPNPSASLEPGVDARSSSSQKHSTPAHRPLNSKTEKMIGRGG